MNCAVWKQTETRDHISFPEPSESLILIDETKTVQKALLRMKSADLALNFYYLQRRRDSFTKYSSEANT